jgi:hypothetical protein
MRQVKPRNIFGNTMLTRSMILRCLVLLAVFFLVAPNVRGQEANVYLIKMFDCAHKPIERSQTGFRLRGLKGLVTALHGVADCQRITASSKRGPFLDQPLTIRKIDIDHDVVLLSSSQLDTAQDGGFDAAKNTNWESLKIVKVYGHPYGISSLDSTLMVREEPLKPLKDIIPAEPLSILKRRESPNHLINVLNLQGNLLPGHSGAPILDTNGRVVAVANGGLKAGFAGISWGVPFQDIEWENPNADNKLRELAQLDPNILFTYDVLPTQQLNEVNDETCGQLSRLVMEAQTGFISIVGEPIGEQSFYSKVLLPGTSYGYLYPKKYVGFYLFTSDNRQKVESQYYNWVSKVTSCFPNWEKKELDTGTTPKIQRYLIREKAKSPIIEIGYNLVLAPDLGHNSFTLRLHVETPSFSSW